MALAPLASGLGPLSGLAGLAGIHPAAVAVGPELVPAAAAPAMLPVVGTAPAVAVPTAVSASVTAPAPAPAASTVASVTPTPPSAAGGFAFPYVVGPPRIGHGSGMGASASASAKRKAPEPDAAAAAAAAAARERTRARRRRRATRHGYGDEYVDMNVEVDPDWGAPPPDARPVIPTQLSDQGAGDLGFAGTLHKERAAAAVGLTTLDGDEFGGGPRMPMLPGTWDPEGLADPA